MEFTKIHINAVIAMVALSLLGGANVAMLWWLITNAQVVGCSTGEIAMALVAVMMAIIGGIVFALRSFAGQPDNGHADED